MDPSHIHIGLRDLEEKGTQQRSRFLGKHSHVPNAGRDIQLGRMEPHMLMGWSDGGHRFKGKSGGGWIIKAWFEEGPVPVVVAAGSEFYSDTDIDSYYAETLALTAFMKDMYNLMRQ